MTQDEVGGPAPTRASPPAPRLSVRRLLLAAAISVIGIVLVLWAWHLWPFSSGMEETEDSYVQGQTTVISPEVNGYVVKVFVTDFQNVKEGQPLLVIDDRTYRQQVALAEGQRDNARAQLSNWEQTLGSNQAEIGGREADLVASKAQAVRAQSEAIRVDDLATRGSISAREREQADTEAKAAAAAVTKAEAAVRQANESRKATVVQREALTAQLSTVQAQLDLAKINLANTVVSAPRDGQLSQVGVRLGQYVQSGSQLMFLVPQDLWVIANFKETQTRRIRVGQPAELAVDALGDERIKGWVEAFSPATGSQFSVLPADNATGNFTKVVQRLPIRIRIDTNQTLANRLRPGMSVVARVDTSSATGSAAPPRTDKPEAQR